MKKYGSLGLEVCDWDFMCNFWLKNEVKTEMSKNSGEACVGKQLKIVGKRSF